MPNEVVQEVMAGGRTQFSREEFRSASWLDKRQVAMALPRRCPRGRWIQGSGQ